MWENFDRKVAELNAPILLLNGTNIFTIMATFKEWKRDFYIKSKWDRAMIVLKIIGILIAIIALFYGGKYIIINFVIENNNTQVNLAGDNKGQICVNSNCELTQQYSAQAEDKGLTKKGLQEYQLGNKYKEKGNYEKAREHFFRAIEIEDSASGAWYKLGYIEFYEGNLSGALQYFKNAQSGCDEWYIMLDEDRLTFCNSVNKAISDMHSYKKNYSASIKYINKVEDEYFKINPPALKFKAQKYMLNKQYGDAKKMYLDFINLTTQRDWNISKGDKGMLILDALEEYCYCKYKLGEIESDEKCEIHRPIEGEVEPPSSEKAMSASFVDKEINNSGAFR